MGVGRETAKAYLRSNQKLLEKIKKEVLLVAQNKKNEDNELHRAAPSDEPAAG